MNYLWQYTYPELATVTEPVNDWTGVLWLGPNRKGLNAPNPTDLWKAWQKDVQKASEKPSVVRPEVMDYFQATKHFGRPPKKGEEDAIVKQLIPEIAQKVRKAVEETNKMAERFSGVTDLMRGARRFTWSYSQLNQFETCPFQWASERYYNTAPRQDTEQTRFGTQVHSAFEDYVNTNGQKVADAPYFMGGIKWAQALVAAKSKGASVFCELEMALDRKLKPVPFDSDEAWARGIADVVIIKGNVARIWDWKTGREKDDLTQLLIFCAFLAQHYPELEEFQAEFVWLKHDKKVGMPRPITRKELLPVWRDILTRVQRMETAVTNECFNKKPNGLCRDWCGVMECPNNGRR